jgi:hypothetical protein
MLASWATRRCLIIPVAVLFGGLLLGNRIIADRPLPALMAAAPPLGSTGHAAAVPIELEHIRWSIAPGSAST